MLTAPSPHRTKFANSGGVRIAYNEFGRADAWRMIANANPSIQDPMRLRPGSVLLIPPA